MSRTLCVLLWAQPGAQAALTAYEDRVLRRGRGRGTEGQPAEIQFIDFPSQAALDAYMADPRRTALAADRDRAVARTEIIDVELVPLPPPA
jgi:uncharacterized protein (DUF1330 family)